MGGPCKWDSKLPKIIQGGMSAGVSGWELAREVSSNGQLGVVAGTALGTTLIRRLNNGDLGGELRDSLAEFPDQKIADKIKNDYFIKGGKSGEQRYQNTLSTKFKTQNNTISLKDKNLENLIVAANFVEVNLAKKGHNNPVGINYLHKIRWPLLPSIYGAMLAGVDFILIGAGFAAELPKVIENLSIRERATTLLQNINYSFIFNPNTISNTPKNLEAPKFLAIVSNHLGARAVSNADGFIFENYIAGGHNPPAREKELTEKGEPNYGIKDEMNYPLLESFLNRNAKINGLVQPYWLAGGYANKLNEALKKGAEGIQVGTPFAFCQESRIKPTLKQEVLERISNDNANVYTDPRASPTGFPFKVLQIPGTISSKDIYNSRKRHCDLGYLNQFYVENGIIKTRCPADNIKNYIRNGGKVEDTEGRKCICNALISTIGLGYPEEPPIVTAGSDLSTVKTLSKEKRNYTSKNVIDYILK
ncbi:nitronate monooxygenase [Candidatus Pacearchaeota archaeon]|nr:nitronate monooxygenase [Candidatus Pacearchaeota archaeon]